MADRVHIEARKPSWWMEHAADWDRVKGSKESGLLDEARSVRRQRIEPKAERRRDAAHDDDSRPR